ncbi:hypothetical protein V5799_016060 [Amblyomma americanum]|uniref:Uncharacterized protein n=1 Tax=Amblyomma americanum TaxID=6943 RepID=A0AAQ4F669_AMBAM
MEAWSIFFYVLEATLLLVISYAVLWMVDRRSKHCLFKKLGVPGPKPDLLWGNWKQLKKNRLRVMTEWIKQYGKVFGIYLADQPFMVITDTELIRECFIKATKVFQDRPRYSINMEPMVSTMPLLKGLSGVVGTITGNILDINCGKLNFDRKVVCGKPIFISVEATTPFAKCLGKNGLTCDGNTPVYEPVALGSVKVLACLVVYVLTTDPNEAGAQLGCDLLAIVSRTFGSAGSALLSPLLCALQNALRLTCSSLTC